MGGRTWAAIGNVLRISALGSFLGAAVAGFAASEAIEQGAPTTHIFAFGVVTVVNLIFGALYWMAKGPLVSGSPSFARWIAGVLMILWIVSSLGLALIVIGIVYAFTSEPDEYRGTFAQRAPVKRRFTPPVNWHATGRIGPSGAMAYSDVERAGMVAIFDSYIPVQVIERHDGLAHVVASSGERGWIDARTLSEAV